MSVCGALASCTRRRQGCRRPIVKRNLGDFQSPGQRPLRRPKAAAVLPRMDTRPETRLTMGYVRCVSSVSPAIIPTNYSDSAGIYASWFLISTNFVGDCRRTIEI